MTLDAMFSAYVTCALWSSTDDESEPLDARFSADDLSDDSRAEMRSDCENFLGDLKDSDATASWSEHWSPEQLGHDFWLTRNGHGAGFWDRGRGTLGDDLTAVCKPYGTQDLYVGDDGKLYVA